MTKQRTNSREKGIKGEYKARDWFRRWKEFADTERSYGQARRKYSQPDIIGQITEHFYVEAKWYAKVYPYHIREWLGKLFDDYSAWVRDNAQRLKTPPVLMWREDRGDWHVLMLAIDMDHILRRGRLAPSVTETDHDSSQIWEISGKDFRAALDKHFEIKED